MADRRDFDLRLIELVKDNPVLWDSRLHEYKLADKKPALWLEVADKLGSSARYEWMVRSTHVVSMV